MESNLWLSLSQSRELLPAQSNDNFTINESQNVIDTLGQGVATISWLENILHKLMAPFLLMHIMLAGTRHPLLNNGVPQGYTIFFVSDLR